MRAVFIVTVFLMALLSLAACGGRGGSSNSTAPVAYTPDYRYPLVDDRYYYRYYDPSYPDIDPGNPRTISSISIWDAYDGYSQLTTLTPAGEQRENLRKWGTSWINQYPAAHYSAGPGALALPPAGYLFSDGPVQTNLEGATSLLLNGSNRGQAYAVYALQEIPAGYAITDVEVLGDWVYIDGDARGGLNIGVSCFSNTAGSFTSYYISGDLYHPDHWNFSCHYGITPSFDGAAYVMVLVHDGLEARIDGITVTIEQLASGGPNSDSIWIN